MRNPITSLLRAFALSDSHAADAQGIADELAANTSYGPTEIAGRALSQAVAQAGTDLDILNYALTLEHIENAMYRAIIASNLLTGTSQAYAVAYGAHENTHVVALTDTINKLGGTPVREQYRYNFPALANATDIVNLLVMVEDLGAPAYLGAAPLLVNGDLLTVAVQIHTVEAEHATVWRSVAGLSTVPNAFGMPNTMDTVVKAVTPFFLPSPIYLPIAKKV